MANGIGMSTLNEVNAGWKWRQSFLERHGEDWRRDLEESQGGSEKALTMESAVESMALIAVGHFITRGSTFNSRVFRAGIVFAERTKTVLAATEKVNTAQDS